MARNVRKTRRPFVLRRLLAVLVLVLLVVGTLPVAGFRSQANSSYTEYEQGLLAAGFPESYVHLISRLHDQYPNWKFEPYHTGLNWATAVSAQCSGGRSLVVYNAGDMFKSKAAGCYDPATGAYTFVESGYVTASEFAVSFFMDPRNFIREEYILQFESLVYHEAADELNVIRRILSGSVLDRDQIVYLNSKGASNTIELSYAQAILDAGKTYGVNPYYLASKIRNEVGSGGATISGTVSGYEGLYNFYNIYAYGANSIQQSLAWAGSGSTYSRPWTTPVRSISGGAEYIASGYLSRGQNTSYFQRFNVVSQPYYGHQYMTAIHGAAEEARNTWKALSADVLAAERTFVIPVYDNMPQTSAYLADSITLSNYVNAGVANASVNLRTSPTTSVSNKSGTVLPAGTPVTILEEVRSSGTDFLKYPYWYRVSYSAGGAAHEGYVCANYINVSYTQTTLQVGSTLQLQYLLSPSAASEVPTVVSSDGAVVGVNSTGSAVGNAVGTAYITATINNGDRVTACLSVVPSADVEIVPVVELALNAEQLSMSKDQTFQLAAQVFPQNATLKTVTYSCDNPGVATVGTDGIVKAVGGGTAVVVAASADGGVYATCTVTVDAPVIKEPESQTGGLVDLDTSLEQVQQTIAQLQAAIEAAEKLDEETAGLLLGEIPEGGANSDTALSPDALAPGLEVEENTHAPGVQTQTTSFAVQVMHQDGTPADDAAVQLKSGKGKTVSTARLVTEGQYIFEHILNGSYTVEVTAADGQVFTQSVQLKNGQLTGSTDFVLTPAPENTQLGLYLALGAVGVVLLGLALTALFGRTRKNDTQWYRM